MPSMASITVKKADETTDITYDAIAPSAGDNADAIWRQDTGANAALPLGMRALAKLRSLWNGPKTARRTVFVYERPYTVLNSTTNRYESSDSLVMRIEITAPQRMPAAEINEGVYQGLNIAGKTSGLVKTSASSGYSPT